jgi:CheY-like chemotaxis protein
MRKVLIVDDNDLILFALRLAIAGHPETTDDQVLTAQQGEQALQVLRSNCVDLVVTDLRMPIMNGFDLVEQLNKEYPFTPLFVMTGDPLDEVVPKLKSARIARFVTKPFNVMQLADDIAGGLRAARCSSVV